MLETFAIFFRISEELRAPVFRVLPKTSRQHLVTKMLEETHIFGAEAEAPYF
jgi:hypothetical protein